MTDLEKAARLALEALEYYQSKSSVQMFDAAITALRQALEQLAQQQEWRGPVDWEAVAADQAMTIAMMKAEQEAAVLAEREACATVCDDRDMGDCNREDMEARACAAAIRARGQA